MTAYPKPIKVKPTIKRMPTVSDRQAKRLQRLGVIVACLRILCNDKSELSGKQSDWRTHWHVVDHHITGRQGRKLLDVFNLIMVTADEPDELQANMSFERKQELLRIVKPLRIKQGFKEEDYE